MCFVHEVVYLAEKDIASIFTLGPNCRDLKILGRKGHFGNFMTSDCQNDFFLKQFLMFFNVSEADY